MKFLIQRLLAWDAKKIIERYQPRVVAITGSVGKTSTRNAIAAVLAGKGRVRTNYENYNNEFGIPFTIIGVKTPGRSLFGWLKVFWQANKLLLAPKDPSFPDLFVLEYGIDRPGDMAVLCEIARPDVAVLTAISPVHVEQFGSIEKLMEEKGAIFSFVKEGGCAVVNADDARVLKIASNVTAPVMTYGLSALSDVRGEEYVLEAKGPQTGGSAGIRFQVEHEHDVVDVVLKDLIGEPQMLAALGALTVGLHFGLSLEEGTKALKGFQPQPGRMRPIPGIKGSLILDDSYNAAPASMRAALKTLSQFSPAEESRRIAVLGRMAELGSYTEEEHCLIGAEVVAARVDILLCVTEQALDIRRGALEAGFPENHIETFKNAEEAGRWLDFHVKPGDIVLIKGSQSARMEKVVKDVMAEPERARELLVRQYGKWLTS